MSSSTLRTVKKKRVVKRRHKEAAEFSFLEADVIKRSEQLGEPEWLQERRKGGWAAFKGMPMPTLSDEPWRRTDIRGLLADELALGTADDLRVDKDLMQPLIGESLDVVLVNRPGYEPELQGVDTLKDQGVIFCDWGTAVRDHADVLGEHLGRAVKDDEGKFAALAAALAVEGMLLYVPKGVQLEQPLHSIFWAPGKGKMFFNRTLVVIEDGASATLVYEKASPTEPEGQAAHAGIVELIVGENAALTFVELQNFGEHVWTFSHERARVDRDGRIDWIFGAVGSHLTKNFTDLDLIGQGSEGRMSGFYFADGVQHLDHDTQQNHRAANTQSDLLFKGALVDRSRSVWQGMIYVAPGAQKTDGYQANRNLILSKQARADSIPGLEILADDVRCTHGATVSQLEEEPIFYLMSRGLPRRQSERLVIDGFFAPIMERIPFEGVRERFTRAIDAKLS
jgi:Fe-S cluster assembly protein SufD